MKIGIIKKDITFYNNNIILFGNSKLTQYTDGIYFPLYVRTFYIQNNNNQYFYYVLLELCSITKTFYDSILETFKKYDPNITNANLIITTNHTHTSPGGYFNNVAYDMSSGGFNQKYHDFLIHTICQSMKEAYINSEVGTIKYGSFDLDQNIIKEIMFNRSKNSFDNNSDQLKERLIDGIDKSIHLINFFIKDIQCGTIIFTNIHGTCCGANNFITSDINGLLSYLMEKDNLNIICGTVLQCHGDCSPNTDGLPRLNIDDIYRMNYKTNLLKDRIVNTQINWISIDLIQTDFLNYVFDQQINFGMSTFAGTAADYATTNIFNEDTNNKLVKRLNLNQKKVVWLKLNKHSINEIIQINRVKFDKLEIYTFPLEITSAAGETIRNSLKNKSNIIVNS